jgi:uncharacterized MAPEG superfamily protein
MPSYPTPHFTLAYACVLIAALLPLLCALIAKWGAFKQSRRDGGYDNHHPREWLSKQVDWRARANAAQANSFEALPFFIGAVIIAHQLHAPQSRIDVLAFLFVVSRLFYILMYVADKATYRSVAWIVGLVLNIALMLIAV